MQECPVNNITGVVPVPADGETGRGLKTFAALDVILLFSPFWFVSFKA